MFAVVSRCSLPGRDSRNRWMIRSLSSTCRLPYQSHHAPSGSRACDWIRFEFEDQQPPLLNNDSNNSAFLSVNTPALTS